MSVTAVGTNFSEVSRSPSYDPAFGDSVTITYHGTQDACLAAAAGFRQSRYKYQGPRAVGGGLWELVVTVPNSNDGQDEAPEEQWEIDATAAEIEIWKHPTVKSFLLSFNDGGTAIKKAIKDAASYEGGNLEFHIEEFALDADDTAFATIIYKELVAGGGSLPYTRPVLRVRRTYGPQYAGGYDVVAEPTAYQHAALVDTFAIPALVQAQMPDDPAADSGYVWAWVQTHQNTVTIPSLGRIEEVLEFTFGQVSSLLFDVIS